MAEHMTSERLPIGGTAHYCPRCGTRMQYAEQSQEEVDVDGTTEMWDIETWRCVGCGFEDEK